MFALLLTPVFAGEAVGISMQTPIGLVAKLCLPATWRRDQDHARLCTFQPSVTNTYARIEFSKVNACGQFRAEIRTRPLWRNGVRTSARLQHLSIGSMDPTASSQVPIRKAHLNLDQCPDLDRETGNKSA